RAAPALGDRGDRDPLAGGIDRDRNRSRRDALLSSCCHNRRCRGAGRRHDREARRVVRRAGSGRTASDPKALRVSARTPRGGVATRSALAALVASSLLFIAFTGVAEIAPAAEPPVAVEIDAQPITAFDIRDRSRRQFGALAFRGGLVLRSSYRHF